MITILKDNVNYDFPDIGTAAQHFHGEDLQVVGEGVVTQAEAKFRQLSADLSTKIGDIIDAQCKDKKYFHGLGFVNGMDSVARYPTNVDAANLTAWAESVWVVVAQQLEVVMGGEGSLEGFDDAMIKELLPRAPNKARAAAS